MSIKSRVKLLEKSCLPTAEKYTYESLEDTNRWIEKVLSEPVTDEELLESTVASVDITRRA